MQETHHREQDDFWFVFGIITLHEKNSLYAKSPIYKSTLEHVWSH